MFQNETRFNISAYYYKATCKNDKLKMCAKIRAANVQYHSILARLFDTAH